MTFNLFNCPTQHTKLHFFDSDCAKATAKVRNIYDLHKYFHKINNKGSQPYRSKSFIILLGYPDSNQKRQCQKLKCYHYTIAQSPFTICDRKGRY